MLAKQQICTPLFVCIYTDDEHKSKHKWCFSHEAPCILMWYVYLSWSSCIGPC